MELGRLSFCDRAPMKRLNYICCSCPLLLALDVLPPFCGAAWGLLPAAAAALALWAVVWVRLYAGKRLRPEFSLLCVLPQMLYYALHYLQQSDPAAAAEFSGSVWQNLYFVAWLGFIWVGSCSLLPDEPGKKALKDATFLFTSILLSGYGLLHWGAYAFSLFLPAQS